METQKIEALGGGRFYLSGDYKRQIIEEYLASDCTKLEIQRRHGIKKNGAITAWMKALGYREDETKKDNLDTAKDPQLAKKDIPKDSKMLELEAKIKLLERQLEDERLRTEMLNRMVDLAEKTYKIPVRKNSNTK